MRHTVFNCYYIIIHDYTCNEHGTHIVGMLLLKRYRERGSCVTCGSTLMAEGIGDVVTSQLVAVHCVSVLCVWCVASRDPRDTGPEAQSADCELSPWLSQDAGCRMQDALDDVDSGWPSSLRSGLSARLPRLVQRARVGALHSSLARAYLRPATRRVTAGASCLPSRRALRTSASMRGTSSETPLSWSWSCSCTCQHAAVGMLAPPRPELDDGG